MSVILISTEKIRDVLHASRVLVESCFSSCFSYLGFQEGMLTIEVEKEENISLGSLSLVFTLSM